MRRRTVTGWMTAAIMIALSMSGCTDSKAAKEARVLGITQLNEGLYSEAVASFDTALLEADGVVNKFELDILKYRAEAEYNLADYAAAEHTYGILIDVDGGKPEYHYLRAASLALSGKVDEAVKEYDTAKSMNQGTEKKADKKADKNTDKNTEQNTDSKITGASVAMSAIGKAYTDAGDYEKAMSFYQGVVDAGGETAKSYNEMGLCMNHAGKYDEAVQYFDKGIALGDADMTKDLLLNKGAVYEQKGDFLKALEVFRQYVSAYGSTPELEKEIAFLESR